ncbi:O-antigen ligase family protein [Asanoa siamensis]|uniref:O-antigen ligase-related domain-containing protein n=1 Tax=Asanoa siamensis TaxID=926357 RepID=A0ABQ4CIY0_9ACTN|nr:O-antigen ligase family protein [Asanoa siamensis]GIF71244.1 hypothetical protein Asi02nite_07620 [Asanoa siamensis]
MSPTPSAVGAPVTGDAAQSSLPAHAAALLAALAAGVVAQGGFYAGGRLATLALTAVALGLAFAAARWSRRDAGPLLFAAGALIAWVLLRAALAGGHAPTALATAGSIAALVSAVTVLARTTPETREQVVVGLLGIGLLVAVTGWIGVAWHTGLFAVPVEQSLWRAASTLTYPNAAAAVLTPIALLALARHARTPQPTALGAAVAFTLLVGLGATLSRAAAIAFVAGLIVLVVIAGRRVLTRTAPVVAGAVLAVGALLPSVPVDNEPRPSLALGGLLAGLAVVAGATRAGRRTAITVAIGAGVAAAAALAVLARRPDLTDLVTDRFSAASAGRSGATGAALDLIAAHPLIGSGPGIASYAWMDDSGAGYVARYVHNEYLQTVVDLGAVGGLLLLALCGAIAHTVRSGLRTAGPPPAAAVGATAGLVAFAVHSAFDFLWQPAVLPLLAGLLIGLAGPVHSEEPSYLPTKESA